MRTRDLDQFDVEEDGRRAAFTSNVSADARRMRDEELFERLSRQHTHRDRPLPIEPMRDKQEACIDRLLAELVGINPDTARLAGDWYRDEKAAGRMSKSRASEVITRLKRHCGYEEGSWKKRSDFVRPERVAEVPIVRAPEPIDYFDDIPDGYYALHGDDGPDHIRFFRVSTWPRPYKDEPRPGRKVQVVIGGKPDKLIARAAGRTVLREIRESGYRDAAMLYAQKIDRCHRCNIRLTDAESRAVGMGRTCASKGF